MNCEVGAQRDRERAERDRTERDMERAKWTGHSFMQRPVQPSFGRVKTVVDG